ncbi:MAG: hypothetical protein ACLQLG_10845 [Thermoguttaceae bacterium]
MRRHILGILAMAFLLGAAALWRWSPGGNYLMLEGMAWRVGALLTAWWLAYPDLDRLPGWLLVVLPAAVLLVLYRPKFLWLIIPALIVLALIRPRLRR